MLDGGCLALIGTSACQIFPKVIHYFTARGVELFGANFSSSLGQGCGAVSFLSSYLLRWFSVFNWCPFLK